MKVLYTINLLGDEEKHKRLDKIFRTFISDLQHEELIFDYGHKLQKVDDNFIYQIKGELKQNEVAMEKTEENGKMG